MDNINWYTKYLTYKKKYIKLKKILGGYIGNRGMNQSAKYKYINHELAIFIKNNPNIIKIILELLQNTVIFCLNELKLIGKLNDFKKSYNTILKQIILTGGINLDSLIDNMYNPTFIKKELNIRICLSFLDHFARFCIKKSNLCEKIINFFDHSIRLRDKRNISMPKDELCIEQFYTPNNSKSKTINKCTPMVELIEPYTSL